jgi:hypothetical protein
MKWWKYILTGIGIAVAILILFLFDRRIPRNTPQEPQSVRVDTLFIRDTIKVTEPVYATRRMVDSVLVPVTDTIRLRDTLYVFLEREQIRWEDSLSVVYASGVRPEIDSVIHYAERMVIVKEIPVVRVKKTRWGVGIQAGAGATRDGLTPYVGVGVSYNILSW